MAISFTGAIGCHPELLSLQAERVAVYGSNLVNAETPNYQASDFDIAFQKAQLAMEKTHSRHLSSTGGDGSEPHAVLTARPLLQTMIKGNNVDEPLEQAMIARTLADYSVNMSFIQYHLSALSAAINGR